MEGESAASAPPPSPFAGRNLEELAIEGEKHLETSVQSAHEALASLNELLSNPTLWEEAGWSAVEEARQKYKAATTSVRNIVAAIFNHPEEKKVVDQAELDRLQKQALELRQEVVRKNDVLKQLIAQMRDLVRDISLWQH